LEADYRVDSWQVTDEVFVSGEGNFARWIPVGSYSWKVGGFYLHDERRSNTFFPSFVGFTSDNTDRQTTDAWNLGFDFEYDIVGEDFAPGLYQLTLEGGARYNWERKSLTASTELPPGVIVDPGPLRIPSISERRTQGEPTGEVSLSWKPVEFVRLYAKYTRGFKAGQFNTGAFFPSPFSPIPAPSLEAIAPEEIDAFEIGINGSFLDSRIEIGVAAFHYEHENLQIFDVDQEVEALPIQRLLSADADVIGVEVDVTLRPVAGLLVQGRFGWLDTVFEEFVGTKEFPNRHFPGPVPSTVATFDYEGNRLPDAPQFSASGRAAYELPLLRWGRLIPAFDFRYQSKVFYDVQNEDLISQKGYWVFGGRLAYQTPDQHIELAGWVRNMLNKHYKTDVVDLTQQFQVVTEIWSEPRTYGFTVSYSW